MAGGKLRRNAKLERSITTTIRLPEKLHAQLIAKANEEEGSVTSVIVRALKHDLNDEPPRWFLLHAGDVERRVVTLPSTGATLPRPVEIRCLLCPDVILLSDLDQLSFLGWTNTASTSHGFMPLCPSCKGRFPMPADRNDAAAQEPG